MNPQQMMHILLDKRGEMPFCHHNLQVNVVRRYQYVIVYWVCLAIESMNEIYVNNLKDEIVRKKENQQHSNIYQSTILSTKIIIHTISVTDLFDST
jgi:hypothetical protein